MTDNIRPEHYRTGEIDLYEAWYRTYPFNEYRAIMQAVAERYMRRDKIDRVEDLDKAIETLRRLKEKEIEHKEKQEKEKNHKNQERISFLENLTYSGFEYLAKDMNDELWAYEKRPKKYNVRWAVYGGDVFKVRGEKDYPEVRWSDKEPTKITDLWDIYENGGENGN